jgi:DNA-binding transcriptional LysR family regulator
LDPLLSGSDYNQLRAFVAVGELLSFSRAAESLGVSASALSQTVRALEERIGVRLLNRTTRSVALTDAGESLFRRVRPAVSELGDAVGEVQQYRERVAGVVRVHAFRSAAKTYVEPILPAFTQAYPDVVLDLTLDDQVVDVVAGGFDAAIRIGEVIERDMVAAALGKELRQVAVASPDYLALHGCPEHPRDLVRHRCIQWRWPGRPTPYAWEFFENGSWFQVVVAGPLIINEKEMAIRLALQGVGIAFAVEETVADHIAAGRLKPVLERWSARFPGYFLCYPQQRQMAPALRAFIDAVRGGTDVPAPQDAQSSAPESRRTAHPPAGRRRR